MNHNRKGIGISFIVHALFILFIAGMNNLMQYEKKAVIIDFTIENSSSEKEVQSPPPPENKRKELEKPGPVQDKVEKPVAIMNKPPEINNVIKAAQFDNPGAAPVAASPTAQTKPIEVPQKQVPHAVSHSVPNTQTPPDTGTGLKKASGAGPEISKPEELRNRYLKEHFAYIRDLIMHSLSFPAIAKKMGWTGKVTLSFTVKENGLAENIKIVESSGFNILDKNAVDTINRVSPFPKPPVEAQLTVPIAYKLN